MKLCSFECDGRPSYGWVRDDGRLVDVPPRLGERAPDRLEGLIAAIQAGQTDLAAVVQQCRDAPTLAPDSVRWLPPIRRPGKVLGVALNNRIGQLIAHRPFAAPAFFVKPASCLTGHGQPLVLRDDHGLTHPEPELAVVIGRGGKDIPESEALDHVFGYTIINDITSPGLKARDSIELVVPAALGGGYRDLMGWRQIKDEDHARSIYLTYHALSKGADTFGPMGPWIVTADEIANPNQLAVHSYDGEQLVFEDSTADLVFSVEQIIAHASRYMTLETGDIIHCGTAMQPASGSPYQMITQWDLAKSQRPMGIEIQGIGRLVTPVQLG